jgi:hypothetical protein
MFSKTRMAILIIDGELEDLQEIVSQMGTDEMKKDFEGI